MEAVISECRRVAKTRAKILLQGPTGSGKGLYARAIHFWSDRAEKPFRATSLACVSESVAEGELFGHEKNSFTGAAESRLGRIRAASGGTMFLEELDSASPEFQTHLLNVVEDGYLYPVGSDKPVPFDVRWIAASLRDLRVLKKQDRFRNDLYWRLKVVVITLPPLRERKDDILPLARRFLDEHRPGIVLSPAALDLLLSYGWPGNVREVQNVMECIACLETDHPEPEQIRQFFDREETSPQVGLTLAQHEDEARRRAILDAMQATGGDGAAAAKILGIGYSTLRKHIQRLFPGGQVPCSRK